MKALISKREVDARKPADSDYILWDTDLTGFGVKITPKGAKIYLYRYRFAKAGQSAATPQTKLTIGKHGSLTPEQARNVAKGLALLVAQGIDPRQAQADAAAAQDNAKRQEADRKRAEGELAFGAYAAKWLAEYELDRRPNTVIQAKVAINRYLSPHLGNKPIPHIRRSDLQPIIDAIPANMRAARQSVFAYGSSLFGWAQKRGDIESNPFLSMAKPKGSSARDRVLTDGELVAIWKASSALKAPFGNFYRLLILTGQRREEVASMAWQELDRSSAEWVIPPTRAKNGKAHIVPLSPEVLAEIDQLAELRQTREKVANIDPSQWPKTGAVLTTGSVAIRGYSKAKVALDAAIATVSGDVEMAPWVVHDLRRTLATGLQKLGQRLEVTEAVLNHVSGARGGIVGVYQRHDWKDEKRTALESWARHVAAIISPAESDNVVSLTTARRTA